MTSIKKSVRLSLDTANILHKLTVSGDDINWSGSINAMAEQYSILIESAMPDLNDNEKNALHCTFNGYMPHPKLSEELRLLHWHISEGYQYDEQVRYFLGSEENALAFIERIKNWSDAQKIAVIFMARSYWRSGTVDVS